MSSSSGYDTYSYSYSSGYTGSYTEDYDYSDYSTYSTSETITVDAKESTPTQRTKQQQQQEEAQHLPRTPHSVPPPIERESDEGEYSYSYSYDEQSDEESYSYSYSYTNSESAKEPRDNSGAVAPGVVIPAAAPAALNPTKKSAGNHFDSSSTSEGEYDDSYSYSYSTSTGTAIKEPRRQSDVTHSGDYSSSYSYSYSYSETDTDGGPRPPPHMPAGLPQKTPSKQLADGTRPPMAPAPPTQRQPQHPAQSTSSDYSYSYSSTPYSGSTMTYSSGYYSGSYSYTGTSSSYDDDYYSSYTDDETPSSYYDDYSTTTDGEGRGRQRAGEKSQSHITAASPSSSYYTGTTASSSYYSYNSYSSTSYTDTTSQTPDSYTYSTSNDATAKMKGRSHKAHPPHHRSLKSSKGAHAESSTTSSYEQTSEGSSTNTSAHDDEEEKRREQERRDVIILKTPASELPKVPPPPRRCFVSDGSEEDVLAEFLRELEAHQRGYEAQRTAAVAAAPSISGSQAAVAATAVQAEGARSPLAATEELDTTGMSPKEIKRLRKERAKVDKEEKKRAAAETKATAKAAKEREKQDRRAKKKSDAAAASPAVPTPVGFFSRRSVRMALSTLRLSDLERREACRGAPMPMPAPMLRDIMNTCAAAKVREHVAHAFLDRDCFRSGELPLSIVGAMLSDLGLAESPEIGGVSLNVSSQFGGAGNAEEMVMTVKQPAAARATAEGQGEAAVSDALQQQERTSVPVLRIVRENLDAKRTTCVHWRHDAVFLGTYEVCRGIHTEEHFQRLKTYIEAATYACVLVHVFAVAGGEGGSITVQYPHLVRSLLMMEPPTSTATTTTLAAGKRNVYVECAMRRTFHPVARLAAYAAGKAIAPLYNGADAVESTLQATQNTEEKRRRNAIPNTTDDYARFQRLPPPATHIYVELALSKVRTVAAVPPGARPFCLVSAVTSDNVFLPAVEVPVRGTRQSKRDGGVTWTFVDKSHKADYDTISYMGPGVDRLYIECCYVTADTAERSQKEEEDDARETVWCAGYAVVPLNSVKAASTKSLTIPSKQGSLLDAPDATINIPGLPTISSAAGMPDDKGRKKKQGIACFGWFKRSSRKLAADCIASDVRINVFKVGAVEAKMDGAAMPTRYITLRRHVAIVSLLRTAIERHVGGQCTHAAQALRQQFVLHAFTVAASRVLLDQLAAIWRYRQGHFTSEQQKDIYYQHQQLLQCAAALAALHNCSSVSAAEQFSKHLIDEKPLSGMLNGAAPLRPITV